MLQEYKHLFLGLERCWSREIQNAHALRERIPVAERDSDQDDNDERLTERWCAVNCVLYDAVRHRREGSEEVPDWDITKYFDEDLTAGGWNLRILRGPTFAPLARSHLFDSGV